MLATVGELLGQKEHDLRHLDDRNGFEMQIFPLSSALPLRNGVPFLTLFSLYKLDLITPCKIILRTADNRVNYIHFPVPGSVWNV